MMEEKPFGKKSSPFQEMNNPQFNNILENLNVSAGEE